jgi:hypothetical protein
MAMNTFRMLTLVVLAALAYFAFFSEKFNEYRRRAPASLDCNPLVI